MNIIEATQKAVDENKAIYRNSLPKVQFIPTNSGPLAFVVVSDCAEKTSKFWNPNADDILASDWKILN